jgi:hypothetical protein
MPIYRIYVEGLPRERGFYVVEAADDRAAVRRAREHHGEDGIIEIEAENGDLLLFQPAESGASHVDDRVRFDLGGRRRPFRRYPR